MAAKNQDNFLSVSIVTPGGSVFESSQVKVIVAPSALGEVAILPHHAPLFAKLNAGEITVKTKEQTQTFAVFGGFMDVNPEGQVTVLADFAKRSHEIVLQAGKRAREEAERLMQQKEKYSEDEFAHIETTLKQALFSIKIAEKTKRKQV